MAARKLRIKHSDEVRAKIQASFFITRLTDFVKGKITMTPAQVRAAEILLRKSVPDLSSVEMSGPDGSPIPTEVRVTFIGGGDT